jgi:hypothetical protein
MVPPKMSFWDCITILFRQVWFRIRVTSDVVDINTATKEEHIRRDIKIFAQL